MNLREQMMISKFAAVLNSILVVALTNVLIMVCRSTELESIWDSHIYQRIVVFWVISLLNLGLSLFVYTNAEWFQDWYFYQFLYRLANINSLFYILAELCMLIYSQQHTVRWIKEHQSKGMDFCVSMSFTSQVLSKCFCGTISLIWLMFAIYWTLASLKTYLTQKLSEISQSIEKDQATVV